MTSIEIRLVGIATQRIRLKSNRDRYQLRPDTMMPYMVGKAEEVEKGLYLRRYGALHEGIAHVLWSFRDEFIADY